MPKWTRGGERPKPQPGVIIDVRSYELHGTPYFAVLYRFEADPVDVRREARLSFDMIHADPRPGDPVLIESLLGVVDRMQPADPAGR
jgi:hypothetical protein